MTEPIFLLPGNLLACLTWRYAVKKFDPQRTIPPVHLAIIEQALVLCPSSYGLQPWRFIMVTDPDLRRRLLKVSMDQHQVIDCSHLVIMAARTDITTTDVERWIERLADHGNRTDAYRAHMAEAINGDLVHGRRHALAAEWAQRQTYLALGFILASVSVLGIDACPMEGFSAKDYDEILGLTTAGFTTAVIVTLGYRHAKDSAAANPKVRFLPNEVVIHR